MIPIINAALAYQVAKSKAKKQTVSKPRGYYEVAANTLQAQSDYAAAVQAYNKLDNKFVEAPKVDTAKALSDISARLDRIEDKLD